MRTVLVTGGIGSGKSLACRILRERGVPVYDFDTRAKALYDTDPVLLAKVVEAVGPYTDSGILTSEGLVDRRTLSSIVFNDARALADLEAVVHPAVMRDFMEWADAQDALMDGRGIPPQGRVAAAESAIALEKPLFRGLFDKVVLVDAPLRLRLERAAARDGAGEGDVASRMRAQSLMNGVSQGAAVGGDVDYIIENDKDEAALAAEIDKVLLKISQGYED